MMDDFGNPLWRYRTWNFGDEHLHPEYRGFPFRDGYNYTAYMYFLHPEYANMKWE